MKTRAALFRAPGQPLEVREIELGEPRAGEVLVRMAAVGICGTDLHQIKGEWQRPTPMVLGHEGAGVVEVVGEDVTGLAPGDRVVLSWGQSAGGWGSSFRCRPRAGRWPQRALAGGTVLAGAAWMAPEGGSG